MEHPGANLFRLSDIPEIFPQITARPPCHIHFIVVFIAAVRAFPLLILVYDDLAVKPAHMAVIGFRVELRVLDIIINKFDKFLERRQIVLQVRNLHIRDRPAGRNRLELTFKLELPERIDFLAHIDVVGIRIIPLVRHVLDLAKPSLINLGKPIAERLGRRPI